MTKVTIIGDIMFEPPLCAAGRKNGEYDFGPSFAPLKSILPECDYVIHNLQPLLTGEEGGYTEVRTRVIGKKPAPAFCRRSMPWRDKHLVRIFSLQK